MNAQKSLSPRAWAELLLLSFIWGASFLSIRVALDEVPVMTAVAHRVFWAALILWGYVWLKGIAIPRSPRIWGAFFVMGLLNNAIPFSLMAWGQLYIETGLTSIFNATTAIFGVVVAAMVFTDERLSWNRGLGVVIGFAGVVVAIGPANLMQFDIRSMAQVAVLLGTLSYAFAGAWARSTLSHLPPQIAAAGMLTGSSMIMVPLAFYMDGPPQLALQSDTWLAIAYFAIIATAGAYLLYYRVLSMAGSGNLMLCTLLIVPVAITLGALILGEALAPRALAGFAVLALGLLILDGRMLRVLHKSH